MKTGNIYRLLRGAAGPGFGLLLGAALLLASCVKEPLTNGGDPFPPVPDGKVRLELVTNADEFQQPVTRMGSANEDAVGNTPWVFVFKDAGDKKFVEAVQAVVLDGRSYVTLTATAEARKLLILANAPANFWNGSGNVAFNQTNVDAWLAGKTSAAAQQMLTTALVDPQTTVPYTDGWVIAVGGEQTTALPMSGTVPLSKIDATTTLGTESGKVVLSRIVAKVTVQNDVGSGFTLEGATVTEASRQSYLFPRETGVAITSGTTTYLAATMGGEVTGIARAEQGDGSMMMSSGTGYQNTLSNPIYIYESAAGTTSVIIQGEYTDPVTSAKTSGYYRLAFKNKGAAAMAVDRNKWYKFTITSVSGPGFETVAEAIAAPPSNNITTTIAVTDLSSHDIVDNGLYYLGVSNSEFVIYADGAQSGLVALTVSTNAPAATAIALSATTAPAKLTVSKGTESTSGGIRTVDVTANLTTSFAKDESVYFTVTVGNLQKTIKVIRRAMLGYGASATEFAGVYTAGKIEDQGTGGDGWLSLSLDGVTPASGSEVTRPTAGSLYLIASNFTASDRTGGIVYLSRQSESGRVKLYVAQPGAVLVGESNCYIVAPNSTPILIPVSRANDHVAGAIGAADPYTAELIWTDNSNRIAPNSNIRLVQAAGTGSAGYILVMPGSAEGNAVVAVKVGGVTKWSWHVWVTNFELPTSPASGTFLDRNLGAMTNTAGIGSLGLLYQWGRKDPFPGSAALAADNSEPTIYNASGTITITKSPVTVANNLNSSVANPAIFYYGVTTVFDWYTNGTAQNNTLWGTSKTVYDPCPVGWKVPATGVWGSMTTGNFTWSTSGGNGRTNASVGGWYPAAGYRGLSGALAGVGTNGLYWSAAINGTNGYSLTFSNSTVNPAGSNLRAYGFAVRCVAE